MFTGGRTFVLLAFGVWAIQAREEEPVVSVASRSHVLPRVVAFGDSITQHGSVVDVNGWVAQLATWYERKADVVNRGLAGYNSRLARLAIDAVFPPPQQQAPPGGEAGGSRTDSNSAPTVLAIVSFGANDMVHADDVSGSYVPLDSYRDNLVAIASHIRGVLGEQTPMVLVAPAPVCEENRTKKCEKGGRGTCPDRTAAVAGAYAAACRRVAAEALPPIPVVDMFAALGSGDQGQACAHGTLLKDGLHFAGRANDALFQGLAEVVRLHFPAADPAAMPTFLPEFGELDMEDPEATFRDFGL